MTAKPASHKEKTQHLTLAILLTAAATSSAAYAPVDGAVGTNGVNNAPTLTDNFRQGTPVLLNDMDPPGDPVEDLDEVYEDIDNDPLAGAAVTANNAPPSEGAWEYSTNNGTSWTPIPTSGLSDNNALLLAPNWRVRFRPAFGFNGAAGTLVGRVWDGTGSQTFGPGQVLAPADIGGAGGFSAGLLDVTVTVINDRIFADGFEL